MQRLAPLAGDHGVAFDLTGHEDAGFVEAAGFVAPVLDHDHPLARRGGTSTMVRAQPASRRPRAALDASPTAMGHHLRMGPTDDGHRPASGRRRTMVAAAIAAVTVLTGLVAGCGDEAGLLAESVAPSTTVAPAPPPAATSTTITPGLEIVDLDGGRVLLHLPPDLSPNGSRTNTGVFGETINVSEFRGTGAVVVNVSVGRGRGVVDMLQNASPVPSDGPAFEGRVYFDGRNELTDLLGSNSLGWQIGPDAVIWITATGLGLDEIADIARHVEVTSATVPATETPLCVPTDPLDPSVYFLQTFGMEDARDDVHEIQVQVRNAEIDVTISVENHGDVVSDFSARVCIESPDGATRYGEAAMAFRRVEPGGIATAPALKWMRSEPAPDAVARLIEAIRVPSPAA
jgi:hypothetical protein